MSALVLYSISFGLIMSLYVVKAALFQHVRSKGLTLGAYCTALASAIIVAWGISPDWDNELVLPISIWIGDPVGLLFVPVVSFLVDFISGERQMRYWYVRMPIEVLLLVPIWFLAWVYIMFHLGWLADR